jgi:hypothetical protein
MSTSIPPQANLLSQWEEFWGDLLEISRMNNLDASF